MEGEFLLLEPKAVTDCSCSVQRMKMFHQGYMGTAEGGKDTLLQELGKPLGMEACTDTHFHRGMGGCSQLGGAHTEML